MKWLDTAFVWLFPNRPDQDEDDKDQFVSDAIEDAKTEKAAAKDS